MDIPRFFADPHPAYSSRREFLGRVGNGFGLVALAGLLNEERLFVQVSNAADANPLAPKPPHFGAKAKSVIWLFMNGGPSQVDTWDYKPDLAKCDGKELEGFDKTTGFFTDQVGPLMKSPFKFKRHGQCGAWVSELFPNMARHVDKMAFLYSCYTDSNNHSPALLKINTGMSRMGYPCAGAWITYGLGTVSQNLPAFVVMYDTLGRGLPKGYSQNWGSGFLPSIYQGTALRPQGAPISNLTPAPTMTPARQRAQLDLVATLNRPRGPQSPEDSDLAARIETFELAYRMQMAAPEAIDIRKETDATHKLYGVDNPKCSHFAKQCLMARRLVERGCARSRFIAAAPRTRKAGTGTRISSRTIRASRARPTSRLPAYSPTSNARNARFYARHLGRRVRPLAHCAEGGHGPRPQSLCLHHVDGGRRHQGRHALRENGRDRPQGGRRPREYQRPARHDPAPSRH